MKTISSKNLEQCLPLLCWENGALISQEADISYLFELTLPEVYTLGAGDFDALHQTWVRALKCLPGYCIVHKQDWFTQAHFEPDGKAADYLSQASDKHFKGRSYLQHRSYLYLTLSSKKQMKATSYYSALCRNRLVPSEQLDVRRQSQFADAVKQFCHILSENGLGVRALEASEVIGEKEHFGLIEHYLCLSMAPQGVLPDFTVQENDFMSGDNYVSCYSLTDLDQLPAEVYTYRRNEKWSTDAADFVVGFTHDLGFSLPFDHIVNQYFFLDEHKDVVVEIEKRGREQQSLSKISRENAINKTFNDAFLNEAVTMSRRAVRCAVNVLLWDNNYVRLKKKNAETASCLANMDCTVNKTEAIVPQLFWGGIPGASSNYPSEMTFLSFLEQACCLMYGEGMVSQSANGFGMRLCDRISGVPLRVDLSDEPRQKGWIDNRNKFILGPSGSGKSFFTNHMVRQYYEQGTHVVIVDVGDSYWGLCKMIQQETGGQDGVYYTYTEAHPISFNPFYSSELHYSVEKREQLSALIFCLWKNENEQITKAEETHVANALNGYLEEVMGQRCEASFNGFYTYLKEVFRPMLQRDSVLREHFDVDNLLQVLQPYYKGGMYDYLLNATERLDLLNKRFIVFEIDNIKDHKTLFPVVTLILMDTFISKMRHPSIASERKMILIEEAWKAISKKGTAEFIKYLYKTVRKHFGEAVVVTQDVEDIVGNEVVKNAIISNADCKILLDQRKYAHRFDEIRNVLALSEKETAIALSVNRHLQTEGRLPYKEVFVTLNGNRSVVYGVEVSRQEYLTYTTEKAEKQALLQLESQTGSMRQAIDMYINQNHK